MNVPNKYFVKVMMHRKDDSSKSKRKSNDGEGESKKTRKQVTIVNLVEDSAMI